MHAPLTYQDALDYLYSFLDSERKLPRTSVELNLPRTVALLRACGDPQLAFPSVIIAGTKGKGSTAALIEAIARSAGLRTGLWTSPHLHSYRERIQVDRRMISQDELVAAVAELDPLLAALDQRRYGRPTVFELGFAIALRFFAAHAVDLAILEVGLGGRHDCANAVTPVLAAITSISYDHMQILGDRLAQIAAEKAGIIKPGVPAITVPQDPEAMAEIVRAAAAAGAPLWVAGQRRATTDQRPAGNPNARPAIGVERFTTETTETTERGTGPSSSPDDQIATAPIPHPPSPIPHPPSPIEIDPFERYRGPTETALRGIFQRENARLATGMALLLRDAGFPIDDGAIAVGLATAQWPGRLEIAAGAPPIVLDGAHNADSARKLVRSLEEVFPGRRLVLVLGTSHDKDIPGIMAGLLPAADALVLTRSLHPRALADLEELAGVAESLLGPGARPPIVFAPDVPDALDAARALAAPDHVICVTGSLFVVAAAREALGLALEKD